MRNVVIVGSGCAGNTAAIYTARANLKPLVINGHEPGGQLSLTTLVENFPGFPEGINGPDLVENMKKQAENFGAEYLARHRDRSRPLQAALPLECRRRVDRDAHADRRLRRLGALARPAQRAEADRPRRQLLRHLRRLLLSRQEDHGDRRRRFRHGGGQLPHPLRLEVTLVHRRDQFRASKIMLDRAQRQSQDQVPHQHRRRRHSRRR